MTAGAEVRICVKSSGADRGLDADLSDTEIAVEGRERILETFEVTSVRLGLLLVPMEVAGGLFRFRRLTDDSRVG